MGAATAEPAPPYSTMARTVARGAARGAEGGWAGAEGVVGRVAAGPGVAEGALRRGGAGEEAGLRVAGDDFGEGAAAGARGEGGEGFRVDLVEALAELVEDGVAGLGEA